MNEIKSVQKLAADAVIEDQTTKEWAAGEEARKAAAAAKEANPLLRSIIRVVR